METRTLGTQGLAVSAIGYGSMGTAFAYGPSDDTQSIAAIRRAFELGVTHFDTAELYGWGTGERLLGHALAPMRDQVTIATKFGFLESQDGMGTDSRPEHIREVVDNSLRNLNVETIDLLYQHMPDPNVPIEEVVGTMKELVNAGKVKYLGLSNADADTIRRGNAVYPISAVQGQYSIFAPQSESLFPTLKELGIGFVAYSPLARGFLSGAVPSLDELDKTDFRRQLTWWQPENFAGNVAIAEKLSQLAESKGISLSQLALAWILAQKNDIVPIPGSRNPGRVAENIAAAEVTLTDDDLAQIAEIAPDGALGGIWG